MVEQLAASLAICFNKDARPLLLATLSAARFVFGTYCAPD
jgi:hypothetical protein